MLDRRTGSVNEDDARSGSEKTTYREILADLELDMQWKVWEKWIGSVPLIQHLSLYVPMSGTKQVRKTLQCSKNRHDRYMMVSYC